MKKVLAVMLLCAMLLPGMSACGMAETEYQKLSMRFFGTFDTIVTIMGYAKEEETFNHVTARAQEMFTRYHEVFDAYNAYEGVGNLYLLNHEAAKGPVQVEPELIDLLLYCKAMQPLTLDTVNVALGAVLRLWHNYREEGEADPGSAEIPPMELLREAAGHTLFSDIIIDEAAGTVAFDDPKLRLDIGAIAKGYATEQVAQWMLESEMPSFLISAGGNVRAGNPPLDGRQRWGVSIQDPNGFALGNPNDDSLDVVYLSGASIVTSGDYQRFYVVDGVRYHHIISPETLMPADYYRSVTVVCEDSGWADMLSTALFLLPQAESQRLAESLEGVEAYWVLNDENETVIMTDGMKKMVKSEGGSARD